MSTIHLKHNSVTRLLEQPRKQPPDNHITPDLSLFEYGGKRYPFSIARILLKCEQLSGLEKLEFLNIAYAEYIRLFVDYHFRGYEFFLPNLKQLISLCEFEITLGQREQELEKQRNNKITYTGKQADLIKSFIDAIKEGKIEIDEADFETDRVPWRLLVDHFQLKNEDGSIKQLKPAQLKRHYHTIRKFQS